MPKIHDVSQEDVRWIDEAAGYDNVSTVGAAYRRLIGLRKRIEEGDIVRVFAATSSELKTIREFDDWVRVRYPVFTDDPLYPLFRF